MPRWMISSSGPLSGRSRNFPRLSTDSILCPTALGRLAYLGPGGASTRLASRMSRPVSHGSSSRRTVSTSGSSGILHPPLVEGSAHDSALQANLFVQLQVRVAADPAAGHQPVREHVAQAAYRIGVHALHGAVTRHVRIYEVARSEEHTSELQSRGHLV